MSLLRTITAPLVKWFLLNKNAKANKDLEIKDKSFIKTRRQSNLKLERLAEIMNL